MRLTGVGVLQQRDQHQPVVGDHEGDDVGAHQPGPAVGLDQKGEAVGHRHQRNVADHNLDALALAAGGVVRRGAGWADTCVRGWWVGQKLGAELQLGVLQLGVHLPPVTRTQMLPTPHCFFPT